MDEKSFVCLVLTVLARASWVNLVHAVTNAILGNRGGVNRKFSWRARVKRTRNLPRILYEHFGVLKPRANGRNIVGCYMLRSFAHPVACCWMLLRVVAQGLKPVTLFSQQVPTVPWSPKCSAMLDPFAQLFQHYWGQASSLRILYKDLWVVSGGLVVSFPRCTVGPNNVESCCILLRTTANTAQQCWELLRPFSIYMQP